MHLWRTRQEHWNGSHANAWARKNTNACELFGCFELNCISLFSNCQANTVFALDSRNSARNGTRIYFFAFKQQLGPVSLAITRNLSHLSDEFWIEGRGGDFSVLFHIYFRFESNTESKISGSNSTVRSVKKIGIYKREAGLAQNVWYLNIKSHSIIDAWVADY